MRAWIVLSRWLAALHATDIRNEILVQVRKSFQVALWMPWRRPRRGARRLSHIVLAGAKADPRSASGLRDQRIGLLLVPFQAAPIPVDPEREPILLAAANLRAHQR